MDVLVILADLIEISILVQNIKIRGRWIEIMPNRRAISVRKCRGMVKATP
jgi:hypothetical protein